MERRITITKTKGIEHLEFHVPSNPGVYLLVGANGSGKTTVLTALHRLCNANALRYGFKASQKTRLVDSFKDAGITYSTKGKSVTFAKREQRWAPTPKNNCSVLKDFGFSDSVFIKAADSRLSPREEEIKKGNIEPADDEVKNAMNMLFDTQRYDGLQRLKSVYGRGRAYIHFYVLGDSKQGYYSEKCFSTGSLAMLRLVEQLRHVESGALILLDEAELALHPKVQLNLLQYLRDMAAKKNLTIFVSTHSPTMIRATDARNIMLIEKNSPKKGDYCIQTPCFPVYALGLIDEMGNSAPDAIFCVEDIMAKYILKELLDRYLEMDTQVKPQWRRLERRVIPIAGWKQTLEFMERSSTLIFAKSSYVRAILDHDVFDSSEKDANDKKRIWEPYATAKKAFDLGVTPELALITALDNAERDILEKVRSSFYVNYADFSASYKYTPKDNKPAIPRRIAKDKFHKLLDLIKSSTLKSEENIISQLVSLLFPLMYSEKDIRRFAKPIFGSLQ